ncbi:MAG: hypothetical protein PHY47_14865 [Lachnospiraceae bacterium]|nr:hypothetical protein [Lachnospiraceae bacterium]
MNNQTVYASEINTGITSGIVLNDVQPGETKSITYDFEINDMSQLYNLFKGMDEYKTPKTIWGEKNIAFYIDLKNSKVSSFDPQHVYPIKGANITFPDYASDDISLSANGLTVCYKIKNAEEMIPVTLPCKVKLTCNMTIPEQMEYYSNLVNSINITTYHYTKPRTYLIGDESDYDKSNVPDLIMNENVERMSSVYELDELGNETFVRTKTRDEMNAEFPELFCRYHNGEWYKQSTRNNRNMGSYYAAATNPMDYSEKFDMSKYCLSPLNGKDYDSYFISTGYDIITDKYFALSYIRMGADKLVKSEYCNLFDSQEYPMFATAENCYYPKDVTEFTYVDNYDYDSNGNIIDYPAGNTDAPEHFKYNGNCGFYNYGMYTHMSDETLSYYSAIPNGTKFSYVAPKFVTDVITSIPVTLNYYNGIPGGNNDDDIVSDNTVSHDAAIDTRTDVIKNRSTVSVNVVQTPSDTLKLTENYKKGKLLSRVVTAKSADASENTITVNAGTTYKIIGKKRSFKITSDSIGPVDKLSKYKSSKCGSVNSAGSVSAKIRKNVPNYYFVVEYDTLEGEHRAVQFNVENIKLEKPSTYSSSIMSVNPAPIIIDIKQIMSNDKSAFASGIWSVNVGKGKKQIANYRISNDNTFVTITPIFNKKGTVSISLKINGKTYKTSVVIKNKAVKSK